MEAVARRVAFREAMDHAAGTSWVTNAEYLLLEEFMRVR
jgi:hypothetical protein